MLRLGGDGALHGHLSRLTGEGAAIALLRGVEEGLAASFLTRQLNRVFAGEACGAHVFGGLLGGCHHAVL